MTMSLLFKSHAQVNSGMFDITKVLADLFRVNAGYFSDIRTYIPGIQYSTIESQHVRFQNKSE